MGKLVDTKAKTLKFWLKCYMIRPLFTFNNTFEILNSITCSFLSLIEQTKTSGMIQNSTQQEVLLITGSGFASRQYHEKDNTENTRNLSQEERLKEACWNGMLKEMLPELFYQTWNAKLFSSFRVFSFLCLGQCPQKKIALLHACTASYGGPHALELTS